jgi:hypothetical protein
LLGNRKGFAWIGGGRTSGWFLLCDARRIYARQGLVLRSKKLVNEERSLLGIETPDLSPIELNIDKGIRIDKSLEHGLTG